MTSAETRSAPPLLLAPGDPLEGGYVIERLLGEGGMGAVYLARQLKLQRRVAVKVLRVANDPTAWARFEREAKIAASLKSPHVAQVLDLGRLPSGDPFIVMEHLEGSDLGAVLAAEGPLAPALVVAMMERVCEALAEAHALGIVHRDLKPSNLFRVARPNGGWSIKVLDFGVSKIGASADEPSLTASVQLVGSPPYMSPEQLRESRSVDGRSDLWSLGVTMFELLTGERPFVGASFAEVARDVLGGRPRRLRALRPDLPLELDRVIARCLATEPDGRYRDAAALAAALAATRAVDSSSAPRAVALAPTQASALRGGLSAQAASDDATVARPSSPSPIARRAPSDPASARRASTTPDPSASGGGALASTAPSARGRLRRGTVIERTALHAVGQLGNLIIVYGFRGSESDVRHVHAGADAVLAEHGRSRAPVRLLVVFPEASRTPPPSNEVRAAVTKEARAHAAIVSKVAVALGGEGFAAATQRAVVAGVVALLRTQGKVTITADLPTAVAKLVEPGEDASTILEFCERELAAPAAT